MPRVKIDLPDYYAYEATVPIRVTDINYGQHVGNDSILSIMHEARMQYITQLGYPNEVAIDGDFGLIVVDVAILYKGESFYGDTLKISIGNQAFGTYDFDMVYRLTHSGTGKEIAVGKTGLVGFNYDKKKLAPLPASFLAKVKP